VELLFPFIIVAVNVKLTRKLSTRPAVHVAQVRGMCSSVLKGITAHITVLLRIGVNLVIWPRSSSNSGGFKSSASRDNKPAQHRCHTDSLW
jgi:hypothetical protein